ncbi:MAG: VCBS repeat-containing protein [Patescibacteria group bacterium]|jgi:hypothetical protein
MFLTKLGVLGLLAVMMPVVSILREDISASRLNKFIGEGTSNYAGYALTNGDFNGDGKSDLLIGAYGNDVAYIIYGKTTFTSSTNLAAADVKLVGEAGNGATGYAVASGDINGDGKADVLISAPNLDGNTGAVYVVMGSANLSSVINLSATTATKYVGEASGDYAGSAVASAGDINGDGKTDFLIGAPYNNISTGKVYLIYGSANFNIGTNNLADVTTGFVGSVAGEAAGSALAGAGDVNGDGKVDILIGTNYVDSAAGKAYLIYGANSISGINNLNSANVVFNGENTSDYAGSKVAGAGDVNGDGKADVLIGASGNDSGGTNSGVAYLIYGAANLSASINLVNANVKFIGEEANNNASSAIAGAGDVNNDGEADLLIGAAGASYLIYGKTNLSSLIYLANANIKFSGETTNDSFGGTVASAGDVNNDGFADISNGAYLSNSGTGAAYLGLVYVDADYDGVAGSSGLITGSDCNDADSAVTSNQTYYQDSDADGLGNEEVTTSVCAATPPSGYVNDTTDTNDEIKNNGVEIGGDSVDNDGDGVIDEVNTVSKNETHPEYGTQNPAYTNSGIVSVAGAKNGNINVTYADNSVYRYRIFKVKTARVTVLATYDDTGYVIVMHPTGSKLALVNAFNGYSYNTRQIAKKARYKKMALQLTTVQNQVVAVVTEKRGLNVQLSLTKLLIDQQKLGKMSRQFLRNAKVNVTHTVVQDSTILLFSKTDKKLASYLVTKDWRLVKN